MELTALPYAPDALSPVISAETLSFHHGKHLQTYVNNLNALLPGSGLEDLPLEEIVVRSEGGLRNNAGQVLNHNLYLHSIACKAAIKAGYITDPAELRQLAAAVLGDPKLKYCPHGRPICSFITKKQIEKQFKRIT